MERKLRLNHSYQQIDPGSGDLVQSRCNDTRFSKHWQSKKTNILPTNPSYGTETRCKDAAMTRASINTSKPKKRTFVNLPSFHKPFRWNAEFGLFIPTHKSFLRN